MARVKHTANRRDRKQSLAAAAPPSPAPSPSPPARNSSRVPTTPTSPGSRKKNARTEAERERKKRRYRPGTVALREIRHFQKTVKLVIPSAPFIRAVREVTGTLSHDVTRWTAEALEVIHEAAEDFLVHLFEDSMLCAIHAKRVTLMKKDLELARRIRGVGRQW